jgi:hypothetical protein
MVTAAGQGRLVLRARAVLCRDEPGEVACRPVSGEAGIDFRVASPDP